MLTALFAAYFLTLGFASLVVQLVVLRELMISFLGNEIVYIVGFLFWFLGTAAGSMFGSLLHNKQKEKVNTVHLALLNFLLAIFSLTAVLAIRAIPLSNSFTGEIAPLWHLFVFVPLAVFPLGILLGLQFSVGTKYFDLNKKNLSLTTRHAYIFETAGFVLGGVLYNFLLIKLFSLSILLLLSILEIALAVSLLPFTKKKEAKFIAAVFVCIPFLIMITAAKKIEYETHAWRFKGQELKLDTNTEYGNISITKTSNQYNFYESGVLLGTDDEQATSEETVHFPLLACKQPHDVLLVGTGFNGPIAAILKHPVESITYLELDPQLIAVAQDFLSPGQRAALGHPKVTIVHQDAVDFLRHTDQAFDVIIVNAPDPSNYFLDRLYTTDFFALAKSKLASNGILSTAVSSAPNELTAAQKLVASSVYRSLQDNFATIKLLPAEKVFFIASPDANLTWDTQTLLDRFQTRNLQTSYLSPQMIAYHLTDERIESVKDQLDKAMRNESNNDLHPITYYYATINWSTLADSNLTSLFFGLLNYKWLFVFMLFALGFSLFAFFWHKGKKITTVYTSMFVVSATTMVMEIVIVNLFQMLFGYVYSMIGLIITLLMLGMLIGNVALDHWLTGYEQVKVKKRGVRSLYDRIENLLNRIFGVDKKKKRKQTERLVALLRLTHMLIALSLLLFLLITIGMYKSHTDWLVFGIIPVFTVIIGVLEGFTFPLANQVYLKQSNDKGAKTGIIYSADVLGAGLGVVIFSMFLIPLLGVIPGVLALGILNLCLAAIFRSKKNLCSPLKFLV